MAFRTRVCVMVLFGLVGVTLAMPAGFDRYERSFFKTLATGAEEVPNPTNSAATARMTIYINYGKDTASYKLSTLGLQGLTQAHLHCNTTGNNGALTTFVYPSVLAGQPFNVSLQVPLTYDYISFKGTLTARNFNPPGPNNTCGISTVDDLFQALVDRRIYLNIHTAGIPSGELRGQFD